MSRLLEAHRAISRPSAPEIDEDHRCAWLAGLERCHYPGTMSRSTLGSGPWYCLAHFLEPDGHVGAQIVAQSRSFRSGDVRVAPAKPERTPAPVTGAVIDVEYELVQQEPGADG